MPKNEGGRPEITPTKSEGVVLDETLTYQDLNITYKDACRWQQMIEHEEKIKEKEIREKRIVTILQLHIFCFDVIFIA